MTMVKIKKISKIGCYLLFMIALSFYNNSTYAQTINSLEGEISTYKKRIEEAEKMLKTKGSQEQDNLQKLALIRSQINNRENIVKNMNKQSSILDTRIKTNAKNITTLTSEQKELRDEYSEMMVKGYKNFLFNNSLTFLFSAKDFNDLQIRLFYLRKYSNMRYELSVELDEKARKIENLNDSLSVKKREYEALAAKTKKEITSLNDDTKRYNSVLSTLSKDKNKLLTEIKQNQQNIKNLQNRIQQIIAEEARKEKERLAKLTQANMEKHMASSTAFAKYQGKLIWPTEKGVISERFGKHAHPLQSNLTVDNKGLNFQVPNNSPIKAVFAGVVTKIFFFQGINNSIMIKHGDYYTTYSGLTDVNVSVGDTVILGQEIGSIKGSNLTLHFELWKGTQNLNPELWLRK